MPKYIPCKYTYSSKCEKIVNSKNKTVQQNVLNTNTVTSRSKLLHDRFQTGKQHMTYVRDTHKIVTPQFGRTHNTGVVLVNKPFGSYEFK
jgi:hypothetical protein